MNIKLFFRTVVFALFLLFVSLNGYPFAKKGSLRTLILKPERVKLYDPFSNGLIEYICVNTYIDGRKMEAGLCDGVIYRFSQGKFYKRDFNGSINIRWYGITESEIDPIKVYNSFVKAWNYALVSKTDIYIPAGVYNIGNKNFPFRVPETSNASGLLDCHGITIYGDGKRTILKTISLNGADVLQLNRLKNLNIRNLSVTAEVKSLNGAGSNGISITNGFDNIVIDQVSMYNLRGVNRNGNLDGGKALTVQISKGSPLFCGKIIATKIKAYNCLYGFTCDGNISDFIKKNIDISVNISVENAHLGVSITNGQPYEKMGSSGKITLPNIKVVANTINCQKDVVVSRGIGIDLTVNIKTTKSRAALVKAFDGTNWYTDKRVWAGCFNYIKNGKVRITGNKPDCDYKILIGAVGSIVEPYNLVNRTEKSQFNIDITGKAKISDFFLVEYQGQSIDGSVLSFSKRTFSDKVGQNSIDKVKINKSNRIELN